MENVAADSPNKPVKMHSKIIPGSSTGALHSLSFIIKEAGPV